MKPQLVTIERTTPPAERHRFWGSGSLAGAGALLCVLLVFLTSFVAVAHFHSSDLGSTDPSCSLCALAHAGVALNSVAAAAPVQAPTALAEVPAITAHSLPIISSHHIRPPPQI